MQGKPAFCGGNLGSFIPNSSIFPEVVGEGDVIPVIHPDGSVQYYFQPKTKWLNQSVTHCCYANNFMNQNNSAGIWLVRRIVNPDHNNSLPGSLTFGMQYPRPDGKLFGFDGLMKFHNDGWTSTTDLHYFYHNNPPPCLMMTNQMGENGLLNLNHSNPLPMETSHMDFKYFGQGEYKNGCFDMSSNVGCNNFTCNRSNMDPKCSFGNQVCKCGSMDAKHGCHSFGCTGNGESNCPCSRPPYLFNSPCTRGNGELKCSLNSPCNRGNEKCCCNPPPPNCCKEVSKCSCGHPACRCSDNAAKCNTCSGCKSHCHYTYAKRRRRRKEHKHVVFTCPSSTSASSYNHESGDNTDVVVVTEPPESEKQD